MSALVDKLAGRRVVLSMSTGKDSVAASLWLREQNIDHDRIFLHTGWEAQDVYDHLEYLRGALGPTTEVRGPWTMETLVEHKGMFPSRKIRFCTEELKVKPALAHFEALIAAGDDIVNAVGVRAEESVERAELPEWEELKWKAKQPNGETIEHDVEVWRPLIRWTEQAVIDIHARHGIKPNPLYLKGASRVGCYPCIFARKAEIKMIAERSPEQIVRIRKLEERVQARAFERHYSKGKPDSDFHPPTFFQAPNRNAEGKRPCMPIDEVVAWSQTKRGGKVKDEQEELFAHYNDGCMRWGMCETSKP